MQGKHVEFEQVVDRHMDSTIALLGFKQTSLQIIKKKRANIAPVVVVCLECQHKENTKQHCKSLKVKVTEICRQIQIDTHTDTIAHQTCKTLRKKNLHRKYSKKFKELETQIQMAMMSV